MEPGWSLDGAWVKPGWSRNETCTEAYENHPFYHILYGRLWSSSPLGGIIRVLRKVLASFFTEICWRHTYAHNALTPP